MTKCGVKDGIAILERQNQTGNMSDNMFVKPLVICFYETLTVQYQVNRVKLSQEIFE